MSVNNLYKFWKSQTTLLFVSKLSFPPFSMKSVFTGSSEFLSQSQWAEFTPAL